MSDLEDLPTDAEREQEQAGWEPPEDAQVEIVCAAVQIGVLIIPGARHWDNVMRRIAQAINLPKKDYATAEQGFMDQFGRFHSRKAALEIVMNDPRQRSVMRNPNATYELYSEDLY